MQHEPEHASSSEEGHSESRLSNEDIPLQLEGFPKRPKPILELGTPYLGTGNIRRGFTLPTGAVWQPTFLLFGQFRSGVGVSDNEVIRTTQWANRLDLFGNLQLSGTERVVFGLRPMDETSDVTGARQFSGYHSTSPDPFDGSGSVNAFNLDWNTVSHLFFEGDFGEIFPGLDNDDRRSLDYGFSVGRQPIVFQEGLLINDFIDALGITRNNLKLKGMVNLRVTGLFSWGQINRNTPSTLALSRNLQGDGSYLFGLFTETDWRFSTVALDVMYVRGGTFRSSPEGVNDDVNDVDSGDGIYAGVSFVQRSAGGGLNSAFRVVTSIPTGEQTPEDNPFAIGNPASRGTLFLSELSWTPHHSHDFIYVNAFWAIENYRAAALDPTIPGPLARAGILFAGTGLGSFPSPLRPTADETVGGAFGYQKFFAHTRQQLLVELGGRYSTESCMVDALFCAPHQAGLEARYQIAMGRRFVLVFDGFAAYDKLRNIAATVEGLGDGQFRVGTRMELVLKF